MDFDAAIYYDIENLIGGYGCNAEDVQRLSLRLIHERITEREMVGRVAIQRAYANWSDGRLQRLRHEMVELGIEPVQMFGFGRASTKNASGIHLAIDVVETALTRGFIKRFVIVSGDGGFSTLAKKLHEYNRVVVGCAFSRASNRVFEAVCDDFIWLDPPQRQAVSREDSNPAVTDPVLISLLSRLENSSAKEVATPLEEARKVFSKLIRTPDALNSLRGQGLNISIVSQSLQVAIPGFSRAQCGFSKLVDLIRYLAHDSSVKLVHKAPSDYRLLLREVNLKHFDLVESLTEVPAIHSVSAYRELLERGSPVLRLGSPQALEAFVKEIASNPAYEKRHLRDELLGLFQERTGLSESELKGLITSFILLGIIQRTNPEDMSEHATFTCHQRSLDIMLQVLWSQAINKIHEALGEVRKELLSRLLGFALERDETSTNLTRV